MNIRLLKENASLLERIAELEAERDRLRAALQLIADRTSGQCLMEKPHNIAKQALEEIDND